MFYHIEGTVAQLEPGIAVIDCTGVGFQLNVTNNTLSRLKAGERAKLYTYMHLRENAMELCGFYSLSEKHSFELLISVTGVGLKAAISILSASTPEALALAIVSEDEKALTVAPGIGKKIAKRIILELKDKVSKETKGISFAEASAIPGGVQPLVPGGKYNDAVSALAVLGYSSSEILAALKDIDCETAGLEDIIRRALKSMVK